MPGAWNCESDFDPHLVTWASPYHDLHGGLYRSYPECRRGVGRERGKKEKKKKQWGLTYPFVVEKADDANVRQERLEAAVEDAADFQHEFGPFRRWHVVTWTRGKHVDTDDTAGNVSWLLVYLLTSGMFSNDHMLAIIASIQGSQLLVYFLSPRVS